MTKRANPCRSAYGRVIILFKTTAFLSCSIEMQKQITHVMKQASVLAPTRMVFDDASSSHVLTFHETESNNHLEYHSFSNPSQTSPPPAVVFQFILQSPVHKHAQEEAKHVFF